ncbi:MAG: type IV toxin-antitoxin system AbiEi family antitoxin domain-containing protein [Phycisphaeraceae bacterium]|nr:type IV toxin-antitoxin system AbiEi family antitoxin domain-containing protein [Phycisphaeraceae bacterium]
MNLPELAFHQPVFTLGELRGWLDRGHSRNKRSREALLSYHLRQGRLLRVRRGLYAVVAPGTNPQTAPVDPYLVAAKSAEDSVLAYHTALEVHGKAHSVFERFFFQSNKLVRTTTFRSYRFECVTFPKTLREAGQQHFATKTLERSGVELRVASLERTLVDLLDRPDLSGGWEEIWRSLESVEYFDLDVVLAYAKLLGNRTTAAKVGYYLQQHAAALMVEDRHLDPLRRLRPQQPHYLERGKSGKLVRDWNLVVPPSLAGRSWEEVL